MKFARLTPAQREARREYFRFLTETYARRAGRTYHPKPGRRKISQAERGGTLLPARPLAAQIETYVTANGWERHGNHNQMSEFVLQRFADVAGVSPRLLQRVRFESQWVRLDTADRLTTAMGVPLSLIYPEDK